LLFLYGGLHPWSVGCSQNKAHFTLGVKGDVELKSSIPIGAKVEIRQKKNYIYIDFYFYFYFFPTGKNSLHKKKLVKS
jgi:hypothetical protein